VRSGTSQVKINVASHSNIRLFTKPRPIHPDYGLELETTRLCWRYEGELPCEIRTSLEGITT
jgi:hypothetical protein